MSQEPHVEFVKAVVSEQGKLPQINPEVLNRVGVGGNSLVYFCWPHHSQSVPGVRNMK